MTENPLSLSDYGSELDKLLGHYMRSREEIWQIEKH